MQYRMTHVGAPSSNEINGNLIALNAFSGIPINAIQGFRSPNLNFTANTLTQLYNAEFLYDSTGVASLPVTDPNTDSFWPYTLDNGMANNCLSVKGLCKGQPKLPGFWEIPMYAFFDNYGVSGPHLYDPWEWVMLPLGFACDADFISDGANGAGTPNDATTLAYMQKTFNDHYNGNRQPIGLYTHPLRLAVCIVFLWDLGRYWRTLGRLYWRQCQAIDSWHGQRISWLGSAAAKWSAVYSLSSVFRKSLIFIFITVWIVSNAQLLDWVRHPVPVSQLDQVASLKCLTPQVDPSTQICNGIPQNEAGLTVRCPFNDSPFNTCVSSMRSPSINMKVVCLICLFKSSTDARLPILHQQFPTLPRTTPRDKLYVIEVSSSVPCFQLDFMR